MGNLTGKRKTRASNHKTINHTNPRLPTYFTQLVITYVINTTIMAWLEQHEPYGFKQAKNHRHLERFPGTSNHRAKSQVQHHQQKLKKTTTRKRKLPESNGHFFISSPGSWRETRRLRHCTRHECTSISYKSRAFLSGRLVPFQIKPIKLPSQVVLMEGLIPFIYKAIKERRSRTYSLCSSDMSAARRFGRVGEEEEDVVAWEEQKQWAVDGGKFAGGEREMTAHRRHRSLEELAGEVGASPQWRQQGGLARGRSARIFSCISGMWCFRNQWDEVVVLVLILLVFWSNSR